MESKYGFVTGYNGIAQITPCYQVNSWQSSSNYSGNEGSYFAVRVLSASITRDLNIPTANTYYLPYEQDDINDNNEKVRSSIRLGYGTYTFNGQISMELSNGCLNFFDTSYKFLFRNYVFSVQFFDGEKVCTIKNCMWNSIKLSCSAGGIPTMSISFQSNNESKNKLQISNPSSFSSFDSDDILIPYWRTGVKKIIVQSNEEYYGNGYDNVDKYLQPTDFNLSFDRGVTPIFLNNKLITPSYLRAGLINVNLDLTLMQNVDFDNSKYGMDMIFGNKKISKKLSQMKNETYNNSNLNDIGNKTCSFAFYAKDQNNNYNHTGQITDFMEITDNTLQDISASNVQKSISVAPIKSVNNNPY